MSFASQTNGNLEMVAELKDDSRSEDGLKMELRNDLVRFTTHLAKTPILQPTTKIGSPTTEDPILEFDEERYDRESK